MKTVTRIVSMLIAILMLAAFAVSCAQPDEEKPVETDAGTAASDEGDTTPPETKSQYDIQSNLPSDLDFKDAPIRILSRDSDWVRDEISVTDYSGETINDAAYQRNIAVEEQIGVKIENTMLTGDNYVVTNEIKNLVLSSTDAYELLANSCYSTIMYTGDGLFRNLSDIEYLDLDQIYWSQGFNEVASFGTRQYFCTGAIALTLYRYMFVTMFNKNMLAGRGIDDLYSVVNDGKWTLDYQFELASQIHEDVNGDGVKDAGDVFGFISTYVAYIDPYWSSCKLPILTKNAENKYVYSLDMERMTMAVDKILNLFYGSEGSYIHTSISDSQNQLNIATHFADGRAATAMLRLASVESKELRDMKDLYGIVPVPKLDEAQENYQTFVHDQFTALAIPNSVPDSRLSMIGAFLEADACESYRTVIPAYYEIALKGKYLSDNESALMLDLIYQSIYIDGGVLYTKPLSSVHQKLRDIIKGQSNTTSSMYKSMGKIIGKQLDAMMAGIDKLDK